MIKKFIKENKYDYIIGRKVVLNCLHIEEKGTLHVDDIRSAAFIGMGLIQKANVKVLIIVDEVDFASGYTAFTESFIQKTSINVLLLSDNKKIDSLYVRCFNNIVSIDDVSSLSTTHGPTLIVCDNEILNKEIAQQISLYSILEHYDGKLIASKNCGLDYYEDKILRPVDTDTGLVSLYVGMINGSNNNVMCICNEEQFYLDQNALNSRYINNRFKLIVLGCCRSDGWIIENGFSIYSSEMAKEFIEDNKKAILFMEGR